MMVLVHLVEVRPTKMFLMVRKFLICFTSGPYESQFIMHFFFVPDNDEDNSSSGNSGLDLETQMELDEKAPVDDSAGEKLNKLEQNHITVGKNK